MKYTVFTKPNCPQCETAKSLIKGASLEFEVVHLDVGQQKITTEKYISRDELLSIFPGARMMPQVAKYVDGTLITVGGLPELQAELQAK